MPSHLQERWAPSNSAATDVIDYPRWPGLRPLSLDPPSGMTFFCLFRTHRCDLLYFGGQGLVAALLLMRLLASGSRLGASSPSPGSLQRQRCRSLFILHHDHPSLLQ